MLPKGHPVADWQNTIPDFYTWLSIFYEKAKQYPEDAWYTYDDIYCGYPCQAHEYFYWITMANIEPLSPEYTDTCENSSDEWNICTKNNYNKSISSPLRCSTLMDFNCPNSFQMDHTHHPHSINCQSNLTFHL